MFFVCDIFAFFLFFCFFFAFCFSRAMAKDVKIFLRNTMVTRFFALLSLSLSASMSWIFTRYFFFCFDIQPAVLTGGFFIRKQMAFITTLSLFLFLFFFLFPVWLDVVAFSSLPSHTKQQLKTKNYEFFNFNFLFFCWFVACSGSEQNTGHGACLR